MEPVTFVLFDEDERALLAKVGLLTPIAFPSKDLIVAAPVDLRLSVLSGLARGKNDPVPASRLRLAREVTAAIEQACTAQSDPGFFTAGPGGRCEQADATALFADPAAAVEMLADTRASQARDARALLAVLDAALALTGPEAS